MHILRAQIQNSSVANSVSTEMISLWKKLSLIFMILSSCAKLEFEIKDPCNKPFRSFLRQLSTDPKIRQEDFIELCDRFATIPRDCFIESVNVVVGEWSVEFQEAFVFPEHITTDLTPVPRETLNDGFVIAL